MVENRFMAPDVKILSGAAAGTAVEIKKESEIGEKPHLVEAHGFARRLLEILI